MILLISETPVAGTVARLANWLAQLSGRPCESLTMRNYAHNAFSLPGGAVSSLPDPFSYLARCVRAASNIFVHNIFNKNTINLIFSSKSKDCRVFFQMHSPMMEAPAYCYDVLTEFKFDQVFSVGQGYGRFWSNATVVPNVVPCSKPIVSVSKSDILFSPHMRSTESRWSKKITAEQFAEINSYESLFRGYIVRDTKKVFGREYVSHGEMLFYLNAVSVVLDDINTGLFHQTTIEGLKAGCAVLSAADLVSIEEFCTAANCEPLPLVRVSGAAEVISLMCDSSTRKLVAEYKQLAQEFTDAFLSEERLAACYWEKVRPHLN